MLQYRIEMKRQCKRNNFDIFYVDLHNVMHKIKWHGYLMSESVYVLKVTLNLM